ncbi:MAG: diaminopimelate epimerase [Clostridiales bacterium]|jgi:diaminopimelate epimerase|nr:diaminopimelate epimerase [Clostridiales bacterium]
MKFTKMQGIGNDYIYINCFEERVSNPAELSVRLSDRHFGIGGDGIILIEPSETADCRMDIYNADGSRAMMCGNGIRCVGKYVYERGIAKKETLSVDTMSGVKTLRLQVENGRVKSVTVDMGAPEFSPDRIPVSLPGDMAVSREVQLDGGEYRVTCVSMGNPHCVLFVDDVPSAAVESVGPKFEHHPIFPNRANIEFVHVSGPKEIEMRVWERGSGETLACGTGACASVAACVLNGKTERDVLVHLKGGDLSVRWDEESGHIFMQGPAEFVFDGTVDI